VHHILHTTTTEIKTTKQQQQPK